MHEMINASYSRQCWIDSAWRSHSASQELQCDCTIGDNRSPPSFSELEGGR